jgi:hypothetical protein
VKGTVGGAFTGLPPRAAIRIGDKAAFGTIVGGGTGALWGTLIGAFVHARPVVYQAQTPKAAVSPTLGPGRGEVTLSVTF